MGSVAANEIEAPYAHIMRSSWSIGIDLGQASDPTAFCGVECLRHHATVQRAPGAKYLPGFVEVPVHELTGQKPGDSLRIRALKRLQLGTSYVDQAQQIAAMLGDGRLADARVFVDATGVGRPIVDLLNHAGIKHVPIWITGGRDEHPHASGGHTVPKLHLISRLQACLHSGELQIAKKLPEATAFVRELQEFRASWTDAGNLRFGARQGAHDDLVLAAALAVWGATRPEMAMEINIGWAC